MKVAINIREYRWHTLSDEYCKNCGKVTDHSNGWCDICSEKDRNRKKDDSEK